MLVTLRVEMVNKVSVYLFFRLWKDWISVLFLSSLEATLIQGDKSSFLLTITVSYSL